MKKQSIRNLIYTALFLAIGFILPMLTGQVPVIGKALLPMHIPVFLCGLMCSWRHGAALGIVLPILRSLIFSVPVMYPTAIAVAFEMATYGLIAGLLYERSSRSVASLYLSMISAMIAGRVVRCAAEMILLGLYGNGFAWQAFFMGVIVSALPGIAIQLVAIPAVMLAVKKTDLPRRKAPSPR